VTRAYSNFHLPALTTPHAGGDQPATTLLDQAGGQLTQQPAEDDSASPSQPWRITTEQRTELLRLHGQGVSVSKAAKLTGMAWSTARLILDNRDGSA